MSFGITELIIILAIVLLLFGTKRLKSLGTDLGGAIKGFKKSVKENEDESSGNSTASNNPSANENTSQGEYIDVEAKPVQEKSSTNTKKTKTTS